MAKDKTENRPAGESAPLETTGFLRGDAMRDRLVDTPTPSFIRRRRRRRRVLALFSIASVGILTLGIIAFLGQNFGDFTIKIDPSTKAQLALSRTLSQEEKGDVEKGTTFLDLNGIGNIACTTADLVPTGEFLDADVTEENEAAKHQAVRNEMNRLDVGVNDPEKSPLNFIYFTFYLKNMSSGPVSYRSTLATTSIKEPDNVGISCTLESLLRVRVYKNVYRDSYRYYSGDAASHDCTTYALPTDEDYTPEDICERDPFNTGETNNDRPDNDGKAVNFVRPSDEQSRTKNFTVFNETDVIARYSIIRFTVVFWLEGSDKDTNRENVREQPRGGSITLAMAFGGVNIDEE
ncbi:MAG: hypothetical protein J6328_07690 [Bacilli bacterium]|nr:hypothetical protein [Bacilli bacterium]